MTATFTTETERRGNTVLISFIGNLDAAAAPALHQALRDITADIAVLMVDLHHVPCMDTTGLLLLLDLHRRAECLGLRVLAVGWQAQPQQLMAAVAGIPGPGSSTGERYALAGFRHLIEGRAERARALDLEAVRT
ncbi:STAS domain-containing protein [Streptomyces sp. ISL-43]|uniref:STAS domain-containing protein n=1 Tax=Streptomyces sp. ISL-43 TaxID=2819183 RepID=UPI0027E57561|nr:STAS domain-containing protein [Streptomyces sp. ISL-43]